MGSLVLIQNGIDMTFMLAIIYVRFKLVGVFHSNLNNVLSAVGLCCDTH